MNFRTALTIFAAVPFLAVSCKSNDTQTNAPVQVQVIELKDTTCTIDHAFPATIKGVKDVAIFPQVNGRITSVKVIEGQFVHKGDILFEIDDVPYKAAHQSALANVEVAKAQLETSRLTLQSKKNLYDKGIISEYQYKLAANEVTTAEAVLGQAKAALTSASNDLSFTKVRTMSEGYVGTLPYTIGSLVGSNLTTPLTTVSENSSVYADFSLTENFYLSLGMNPNINEYRNELPSLKLKTNLGEIFEHTGTLHSIAGIISSQTGTIPARAIFPNPDGKLLSGGSCAVIITYTANNQIVVPRASMKEVQNKLFVFVVRDGKLEQTEVSAHRLNNSQWMILPGENGQIPVKAGDIITTTTNRLLDGMSVEIIK